MAKKATFDRTQEPETTSEGTQPRDTGSPVTLVGRLTTDPRQIRHTKNGRAVTTIRIAVNGGPEPMFHTVVVWGRTAEVVCEFLKKGRLVEVTGRPQERSYIATNGAERFVTEIMAWRVQFGEKVSAPSAGEVA